MTTGSTTIARARRRAKSSSRGRASVRSASGWGLLVWLALAGGALGQADVVEWASLEIAPFEELVKPLQSPVTTEFTARASCLLADQTQGVPVAYAVREQPDWATVVVSPATDVRGVATCDQGYVTFEGTVSVTASDQAPGFVQQPITVEMTAGPADRSQKASTTVNVSASYFSIVDVQLPDSQAVIPPGGSHDFVVTLTNFGNAQTRVEASLVDASEGLAVRLPPPTVLQSRQQGGAQVAADVPFRVQAAAEEGFVNRVGTVNVLLTSAYALDDSFRGDESRVSLLVTVRSGALQGARDVPFPGALAILVIVLLARRPAR